MRLIVTAAAAAQDVQPYSEPLDGSVSQVRERMLRDATVNRHRDGSSSRSIGTRVRCTCANLSRLATRHGRDRPDIRKLYALRAQARL